MLELSRFLSKQNFFSTSFESHLNYFNSQEFEQFLTDANANNLPELEDAKEPLIELFNIFLDRKIQEKYHIFLLDFEEIYKELSFPRLIKLIHYYPLNHIVVGIPSLELPDLALKFIQEFYFKKQFFFMERLKATEVSHLNPVFRFKARQKNNIAFGNLLVDNFKISSEEFLRFIKDSLEKFVPNASELWHLENNMPHLTIFKILKTLLEYSVFTQSETTELMIILLDKAGNLRNLEKMVDAEHRILQSFRSTSMDTTSTNIQDLDKIPFNSIELELWTQSLMKIRQYYAEIFLLGFLASVDEAMIKLLMENLNFVESFKLSGEKQLTDGDRKHIKSLEGKIRFENLEIFNEENGSSFMRIFFRYILVNINGSSIEITAKTKAVTKIFLSFFSNIHDINLQSLMVMGSESFRFLSDLPRFQDSLSPSGGERIKTTIGEFVNNICINKYLLEKEDVQLTLKNFMADFIDFRNIVRDIRSVDVQLIMFMKKFFWVFLQTLRKFSVELSLPENNENRDLLIAFLRDIMNNNLFVQAKCLQGRFLKLVNPEKKETRPLYISIISVLFERFPTLVISNQTYMNYMFDILRQSPRETEEDFEKATKCLGFWQYYLKKKLYSTSRFLPHYDLLCLEQLFSKETSLGQKELFNDLELLLDTKNNLPKRHQFFMKILEIVATASKTRYTKRIHKIMSSFFTVKAIQNLFDRLTEEISNSSDAFIKNLEIHRVLLYLLRNIHIKASENIFDEPETQITYKKKKPQKKTSTEEGNEEKKEKKEKKKKIFEVNEEFKQDEGGEIWTILHQEVRSLLQTMEMPLITDNDKNMLRWYLQDILNSICANIRKEMAANYVYGRMVHFKNLIPGDSEKKKRDKIKELLTILSDNEKKIQKSFHVREFKKKNFDSELEIHGVSGPFKALLKEYNELETHSEWICEEIKAKKKMYSASESMIRLSNKLEDRQKSVLIPYEQLIESLKVNGSNKVGRIYAAIYESFKLKKLSTFSSIKKSEQDDSNANIYMKILKESREKKDAISANFCKFIYTELFTKTEPSKIEGRPQTQLKSTMSLLEIMQNQGNKTFDMLNRNYKYTIIEFFNNVLFHATKTCQTEIFALISQDFEVLDSIWDEIIFNLSYIYNQSHTGKHWNESFMCAILLIKTLQYFCEDNNSEFKKWFKEGFEARKNGEELNKFEQMKEILNRFLFRNSWGKKNFEIMKKKALFPVVQSIFDFLSEIMCGPCVEIQEILTRDIFDFRMIGNLLNTFDLKCLDMINGKQVDLRDEDERSMIEKKEFSDMKSSIIDCLLVCCEGGDQNVMENQSKKFNLYEILETIVAFSKLMCWGIAMKYGKDKYSPPHTLINYFTYTRLKKNFKKSKFNEPEKALLDNSLKLFIYLQILSEQSFTLKHILESKAALAKKNIQKHSLQNVTFCAKRKEEQVSIYEERSSELTIGYVIKFLSKIAAKIEIIDKDDNSDSQSKFIFFKSSSDFSLLSEETKESFLKTVDRTSHETKVHNLIVFSSYFDKEILIMRKLMKKHPILINRFSNFKLQEMGLFALCIAINILMLANYHDEESEKDFGYLDYSIYALGGIELGLSIIVLVIWMIIRFPIEMNINLLKYCEQKGLNAGQIGNKTYMNIIMETIFSENFFRVLLLHIFCCLMGISVSFGFFAMDIFSIINLSVTFQYLAKSISSHGQQLMFTFYIVLIFIYVFSVFADLFFKANFDDDQCKTVIHCFWSILNTGFTNGSGIGGMLKAETLTEDNAKKYFGYVLIDLLFFICVNCIMLNLVFGIIVDTFGELREESEKFGKFNSLKKKKIL